MTRPTNHEQTSSAKSIQQSQAQNNLYETLNTDNEHPISEDEDGYLLADKISGNYHWKNTANRNSYMDFKYVMDDEK